MKIAHAIPILFLSTVIQISFIRLFDFSALAINLPLISLFLLSYVLLFGDILILSILVGLMMDLNGSLSFGSSAIAAIGAFSLSYYLKESIIKGERMPELFFNSIAAFLAFYFFLGIANGFLRSTLSFASVFEFINTETVYEVLLNFAICAFGYQFIKHYKNGKLYGFYWNIKKNIKISP